ncbi:hypothetical protein ONZ45_g3239 [Pleurotus djamor]|nr:hypothetical protein ONZ45_g3239 [Pleurotus djamor]
MLPTSSLSLGSQHRRPKQASNGSFHRNRPPVTRSTSIFGTLKSFVTAPFSWLVSTSEEFADEKDDLGKRRRVAGGERTNTLANGEATHESFVDVDEGITRGTKRLRVSSPKRQDHRTDHAQAGYNDPPANAFSSNAYIPPNRSASVVLPATTLQSAADNNTGRRYTRSPMRASSLALQSSMSVDSYMSGSSQSLQRDVSMSGAPSPRDTSMEARPFPGTQGQIRKAAPLSRDLSLPPTSSRPPFVLRSSLTPQPTHQLLPSASAPGLRRDVSEPPPISSLRQNPIFVRGPPKNEGLYPSDSVTLGTLVENQRSSRSPSRSHSLLFASQPQDLPSSSSSSVLSQAHLTPAQKALHALDIYKTPLVPTRLRASTPSHGPFDINNLISGSISGTSGGPDLFRKRNPLILMNDKDRPSKKRKDRHSKDSRGRNKEVNETKPYAGAGGMKKLLARARADEDNESEKIADARSAKATSHVNQKVEEEVQTDEPSVPPVPKDDWYTLASQASSAPSTSGSSLRVGRSKISRNHIARPSVPTTRRVNKFSAVYEDDTMEDDEMKEDNPSAVIDSDDQRRQKELEELEAASQRAPLFKPPPSFSFAKEGATPAPVQVDTNAQDPPIASLPFSFGKPANTPTTSAFAPSAAPPASAFSFGSSPKADAAPAKQEPSVNAAQPASVFPATPAKETGSGGGVPNFFASSSLLSKPVTPPVPAAFSFAPSASSIAEPAASAKTEQAPAFSLAAGFSFAKPEAKPEEVKPTTPTPSVTPVFGFANPGIKPDEVKPTAPTPSIAPSFSFAKQEGKPDDVKAANPAQTENPVKTSFFIPPAPAKETTASAPSAPGDLFKAPVAGFSFSKPTEPSNEVKPSAPFSFGPPKETTPVVPPAFGSNPFASSTSESSAAKPVVFSPTPTEAPKPLFGGPTPSAASPAFTFGSSAEAKPSTPAPPAFSFSSTPSTPTADEKKPGFVFGAPPVAAPPTGGFSFGGAGLSIPRPATPPKPSNEDNEMRMEESPTREPTHQTRDLPKPTLNFSFGSTPSTNSTLFGGGSPSTTSPAFAFGNPSSGPFGSKVDTTPKPAEPPKPSFGFPSATASGTTPFSFGAPNGTDASRPSSANTFGFNNTSTPTSGNSPFAFGAPTNAAPASNPFVTAPSAPSSPSTFSANPTFTFGLGANGQAPTPTSPATPFSFGSQPASPAAGASALPASGGFGSPAPPGSTPLFTMGAVASNPSPSGARPTKKLPRRPGAKR